MRPLLVSVPLVAAFPVIFPLFVKIPAFANEATVPLFVPVAPTRLATLPAIPPCWIVKVALLLTPATVPLTFKVPLVIVEVPTT